MEKRISSIIFALVASAIMSVSLCTTAHAVELTESKTDGAGNYYSAGEVVNTSDDLATYIENECFIAGKTVNLKDTTVDGSAFVAGADVNVENSMIGSSLFVAGSDVSIDTAARNNIWVFGANVSTSDETSVKGIHAAGANLTVEGEYNQVDVCGETVIFNAKVDGDVNITADNVTIGSDAEVTGDINVTYSKLLHQESGAVVPNLNITKIETPEENSKELARQAIGSIIAKKIKSAFFLLFSNSIIAVLLALLFNSSLKKAYDYCITKTGNFIGFGALVAIMAPTAMLLALITWIGAPTAGLAFMIYATVGFGCKVFTFGSLVRELIFTHTKSRLHPIAETVLAVLPLAIVRQIPFVKGLVGLACAIYTWGYIVLALYDKLQAEKRERLEVVENTNSDLQ